MSPSPSEIAALLASRLGEISGDVKTQWGDLIGPVHKLSIIDRSRSSWEVIPGGTGKQRAAIAKAVLALREVHPYVGR